MLDNIATGDILVIVAWIAGAGIVLQTIRDLTRRVSNLEKEVKEERNQRQELHIEIAVLKGIKGKENRNGR